MIVSGVLGYGARVSRKTQLAISVTSTVREELLWQAHAERRSLSFVAERALLKGLGMRVDLTTVERRTDEPVLEPIE